MKFLLNLVLIYDALHLVDLTEKSITSSSVAILFCNRGQWLNHQLDLFSVCTAGVYSLICIVLLIGSMY